MKRWLFVLLASLVPSTALAQALAAPIPIRSHPQLATYTDVAQRPWRSAQSHWPKQLAAGLVPIGDPSLAHTHANIACWSYREASDAFPCEFLILLHNNPGRVVEVTAGLFGVGGAFDFVWDATGTDKPPIMQGIEGADVTFTGRFKVYPQQGGVFHGWVKPVIDVYTQFPDGTVVVAQPGEAVYSLVDPSAPEVYGFPQICAESRVDSPLTHAIYGRQNVCVVDMLPIAPFAAPWVVRVATYGYGAETVFPPATSEYRTDFDFHHGVLGIVRWSTTQVADVINEFVTLSPAALGPGTHRIGFNRHQPNDVEQITTLLVTDVQVADGVITTPPPPPPPPPPADQIVTPVFHLIDGVLKACVNDKCWVVQ